MKAIFSLITASLASLNLNDESLSQIVMFTRDTLNKPLTERISFWLEAWIAANEIGFCIYPSVILQSEVFMQSYRETIGVDERYRYVVSPARIKTGFKHMNKPTQDQIPYISHHIWLTNPKYPKEMLSQVDGRQKKGYDFHLNVTFSTLKKYNFTAYLWTNNISLIPETQKWAAKQGIIMKELSEFERFKEYKQVLELIDSAIEQKQYAGGADIARLLILYELGGFYTDQDHQIIQYDPLLNKMNLFFYEYDHPGLHTLENSMIGASPKNKFIMEYMKAIIRTKQGAIIPDIESTCFKNSQHYIHFASGPLQMSRVFNSLLISRDLDDQLFTILDEKIAFAGLDYINTAHAQFYNDVVFKDGSHRLNVQFRHLPTGSWMDPDKEMNMYGWQNDTIE